MTSTTTRTSARDVRTTRGTTRRTAGPPAVLAAAGLLFALYPALRPFSDEATLDGAAAFASVSWIVAHTLAIAAFALLLLGLLAVYTRLRAAAPARSSLAALALSGAGVGLTLPYYGAETFGLHTIGAAALEAGDAALLPLAAAVRYGPGLVFIVAGLLLLAIGTAMMAITIWKAGSLAKWSGFPLAAGIALYLPQFATPQAVRVAHGMVLLVACLILAWALTQPDPQGNQQ